MQLRSMLRGEGHVGEHVMLGLVHQPAEFLEPGPQLIGDVPPDLARRLAVGLDEGLADGGGDNRLLRLWNVGQRIAHEVHATALPCRADDPLGGGLEPFVRVRDHELDAAQAASGQALQEVRPEGLGFRRANAEPDDLAPSFGVGGHSDYRGDRDDASALAHLQVGRIQPQIGPVAFERPFEEGLHALVDFLAQFRDLALRDAGEPHRLRDLVDPARRHPADPGLLDDGDQRLFMRRDFSRAKVLRKALIECLKKPEPHGGYHKALARACTQWRDLTGRFYANRRLR